MKTEAETVIDALAGHLNEFKSLLGRRTCWYCQKEIGQSPTLYLDGVWECHAACAPAARDLSGRTITME